MPHNTFEWHISLAWRLRLCISAVMLTYGWAWPARRSIGTILCFWGAKFTKICDSLPWTPMNCHAKYDTASFILGWEIVTVQTHTQKTHTNKTVNDISTPCLLACVDNKLTLVAKSKAIRKAAKEKDVDLKAVDQQLGDKLAELSSCQ